MRILQISLVLSITFLTGSVYAGTINFSGQLDLIELDSGSGVYSGVPIGTVFFGSIDDQTANGSISDGITLTPFGCCIAAGGLSILNDTLLTADDAVFLNSLAGSMIFSAGDLVDGVDIEGDATTSGGGRIKIGLSYI